MVDAGPRTADAATAGAEDHSRDVFSWANVITVLRLALVPVFYWALVYSGNNDLAFGLFVVTAGSDWLDGFIARRTGHVTNIGKIIDPLVDRLLIAASLIGLYQVQRVHLWLLVLLVGRDVYLLYGAWVLERHGRRLAVTIAGKVTTAVLMVAFASLVWNAPVIAAPELARVALFGHVYVIGGVRPLGGYLVYLGLALSIGAAVQYTVMARREYRAALEAERALASGGASS